MTIRPATWAIPRRVTLKKKRKALGGSGDHSGGGAGRISPGRNPRHDPARLASDHPGP